jgi:putative oxidoreductase
MTTATASPTPPAITEERAAARARAEDAGKLLLRITVAGLLLFHGIAKAQNGIGWMAGALSAHHLPAFVGYGVYVAEIVAPIFLIVGFMTRAAALVIAFDMIMALWLVAGRNIGSRNMGGGWGVEIEMFFLLAALAVAALGSGRYAISRGAGRWD